MLLGFLRRQPAHIQEHHITVRQSQLPAHSRPDSRIRFNRPYPVEDHFDLVLPDPFCQRLLSGPFGNTDELFCHGTVDHTGMQLPGEPGLSDKLPVMRGEAPFDPAQPRRGDPHQVGIMRKALKIIRPHPAQHADQMDKPVEQAEEIFADPGSPLINRKRRDRIGVLQRPFPQQPVLVIEKDRTYIITLIPEPVSLVQEHPLRTADGDLGTEEKNPFHTHALLPIRSGSSYPKPGRFLFRKNKSTENAKNSQTRPAIQMPL